MEDSNLQKSQKWLEDLSKGDMGTELETSTMEGLQVITANKGFFRCHFLVPNTLLDPRGNWNVGSIATLIDIVGAAAVYSIYGSLKVSVDFSVSYFSTAKYQEGIEIEAKVVGDQGSLTAFTVEVRKKNSGELIAIGKQWMALFKPSERKESRL